MRNQNGYLSIERKIDQKYYVIFTENIEAGTAIEIVQGEINRGYPQKSRHVIKAPQNIGILRREIADREFGGIENLVEGLKSGEIKYLEEKRRFVKCQRK